MYIKNPILIIIINLNISIYVKLGFIILLSMGLGFICICLFKALNYSIYCVYNSIKNPSGGWGENKLYRTLKASMGYIGILWVLPISECNNVTSIWWAKLALEIQHETRTIYNVINKLDMEKPLASGASRLDGFHSYFLDKYREAMFYDRIARKNQYRTMILGTPEFTVNDSDSFPSSSVDSLPSSPVDSF